MAFVEYVRDWLQAPFRQDMDALHLFLLTGLVIVFVLLWVRILAHLKEV